MGRADILTALIFVAIIIFYRVPSGICTWFLMVFGFTSLAVLCKETGITVLVISFFNLVCIELRFNDFSRVFVYVMSSTCVTKYQSHFAHMRDCWV